MQTYDSDDFSSTFDFHSWTSKCSLLDLSYLKPLHLLRRNGAMATLCQGCPSVARRSSSIVNARSRRLALWTAQWMMPQAAWRRGLFSGLSPREITQTCIQCQLSLLTLQFELRVPEALTVFFQARSSPCCSTSSIYRSATQVEHSSWKLTVNSESWAGCRWHWHALLCEHMATL